MVKVKGEWSSHHSEGQPEHLLIKYGESKFAWFFPLIVGKHHHHMYNSLVFHLLKSWWVCSQCCPFISPWSKEPYDEHSTSMPGWHAHVPAIGGWIPSKCAAHQNQDLNNRHRLQIQIWIEIAALFHGIQEVSLTFYSFKMKCKGELWPKLLIFGFEINCCFGAILNKITRE